MTKRTMPVTVAIESVVTVESKPDSLKRMVDKVVTDMCVKYPASEVIRSEEIRFGQVFCFVTVLDESASIILETHAFRSFGKFNIRDGTRQFKPKGKK